MGWTPGVPSTSPQDTVELSSLRDGMWGPRLEELWAPDMHLSGSLWLLGSLLTSCWQEQEPRLWGSSRVMPWVSRKGMGHWSPSSSVHTHGCGDEAGLVRNEHFIRFNFIYFIVLWSQLAVLREDSWWGSGITPGSVLRDSSWFSA